MATTITIGSSFVGKLDEFRFDLTHRTESEILDWFYCDAAFKDQYSFNNRNSSVVVTEEGGLVASSIKTNTFTSVPKIKTDSYLLTTDDFHVIFNCATDKSATLPAATGSGIHFIISNTGVGTITIDPAGSEIVDGDTTLSVYTYESFEIVDYATGIWKVV
jgi:hypothetical protein